MIFQIIAIALIVASVVGLIIFMVTYARHADWRKTAPGRAIMYLSATMGSVLALTLLNAFVGPYPGAEFVAIGVLSLMTATIWRLVWVLYRSLRLDPFYIFRIKRTPRKGDK